MKVAPTDTILLQSYRTRDVPAWMAACMASVRAWAAQQGWKYAFMDDAFFALAPGRVRRRCAGNLYAVTDICRLIWMKRQRTAGYRRVIWVDADVLVFNPDDLVIPPGIGHGMAAELFLALEPDGSTKPVRGINNAVMVFESGDTLLDVYLEQSLARLQSLPHGPVPRTALGPSMLNELARSRAINTVLGIGLFSLAMMQDIARGGGPMSAEYLRLSTVPPVAANLCHFMRDALPAAERPRLDAIYDEGVRQLLASRGGVLAANQATRPPSVAPPV